MAYNANNEERKVLVDVEKNSRGEHIIGTLITNKNSGNQSLDIRQYYTNDEGSVLPTSKGVRVNTELAYELISGLLDVLEEDELMNLAELIEAKTSDVEDDMPDYEE